MMLNKISIIFENYLNKNTLIEFIIFENIYLGKLTGIHFL
jgi:hypothetical protein